MINRKILDRVYKQDKDLATEIAATLGCKIKAAKDADDRTILMIKSEDPNQKLAAIKKVLEIATNSLIAKAKGSENYDIVDELEKTRDRIVLHLNTLKKILKQL